jgi:hypothetical protein
MYKSALLPDIVLGPPKGGGLAQGSVDVVSLGCRTNDDGGSNAPYGGGIIIEFVDNRAWDGPGPDLTIFENVFYVGMDPDARFMEPATVAVSQDGVTFHSFPCDFSPRYDSEGNLNLRHPYCYNSGFAGVNPVLSNGDYPDPTDPNVSGGDSFDLAGLGLAWIRYVWVRSTGNRWRVDRDGDLVYHSEESGAASGNAKSGFDLDAAAAVWFEKVEAGENE